MSKPHRRFATRRNTGSPKGVLYSHRSTLLHTYAACMADSLALSPDESVLLVVPMFHVNGWGMPYAAPMSGAKLVLPGPALDGKSVYALLKDERVTLALGVPTVWLMLLQHVDAEGLDPKRDLVLRRVVIGGSAAPRAMSEQFEMKFGAFVVHAWGMTEMSPLGTICNLLPKHRSYDLARRLDVQAKQGRAMFGVEMKITDDAGRELPRDGKAFGHLLVRGPWVTRGYFQGDGGAILDGEGFFDTGDVATIDPDGYMQITDRSKDVIKSGGEWISSIEIENAAVGHPAVAEAAVIGVPHPKWQERPLLIVVRKAGQEVTREDLLGYLAGRVAKWWLPDDVVFVEEVPHTATGKLLKTRLREMFSGYQLPQNAATMRRITICLLAFASVIVAGCGEPRIECETSAVIRTLSSMVRDRVRRVVEDGYPPSYDAAKRARLAKSMRVSPQAMRLIEWDANSGRLTCMARLRVAVPAPSGSNATQTTEIDVRYRVSRDPPDTFFVEVGYAEMMSILATPATSSP
jgi:hypothetical protein